MPTSIMHKNYSNCPLKKRPVRDETIKEEEQEHDLEPENLSTKPEDLSKTGNYPKNIKTETIQIKTNIVRTPSPQPAIVPQSVISRLERSPSPVPVIERKTPQEQINYPVSPISIPTPTYSTLPINYYAPPIKSPKAEPINLQTPQSPPSEINYTSPTTWHKPIAAPTPTYPYMPFQSYPTHHHISPYHNEHYSQIYHHQVSPTRSEPLSPYAPRENSVSPPVYIPNIHIKRDNSISPEISTVPPYPVDIRRHNNNNIIKSEHHYGLQQHRYLPYPISPNHHGHHHINHHYIDQSSLSPTSSHTSYNSVMSSRRSLSPLLSSAPTTPEDLSSSTSAHLTSILMEKSSSNLNIQKVNKIKENSDKINNNNGAPRYQCPDCGKSYSTYSGLSKHQQFHCPAAIGNQAKKSFSCKYCDKVYVSLGALKMHIRTHTLPCKCHTCGKAFSRPWLLQGHIRTHTGEKPFSCQHCHRAFADRSNLRAHLQTHSDIKKYSCTTCSKTFSRMSLLTKHNDGGCPGLQLVSSQSPPHNSQQQQQQHIHSQQSSIYPSSNQIVPNKDISVY